MRLPSILIATAVALTLASCGSPDRTTVDGLGEAVADAANDQDFDALKDLTCEKDRDQTVEEMNFDNTRTNVNADDLDITVEFLEADAHGKTATLTFRTAIENLPQRLADLGMSDTSEHQMSAAKEGEYWVLCN